MFSKNAATLSIDVLVSPRRPSHRSSSVKTGRAIQTRLAGRDTIGILNRKTCGDGTDIVLYGSEDQAIFGCSKRLSAVD